MAEDSRDILMKITLNGSAIPAESTASIDPKDPMTTGFTMAVVSTPGDFFSVQEFTFEVGLPGESGAGADPAEAQKKTAEETHHQIKAIWQAMQNQSQGKPPMGVNSTSGFDRFKQRGAQALSTKAYGADLEPISITKSMDASSLTLLKACINSTTIDQAILVKRRGGGTAMLRSYLKLVFTDVLITDFNWSEDDVVKETWKFVCRKAEVQYSVENNDGTLTPPGVVRTWKAANMTN